eukprot:g139.t1
MRSLQNRQKPNLIILNLCLDACRKARNLHAALKLFNDMQIESERPDMLSYTSLISACGYGAEWQLAIQLHEDALMTGQPDIFSFNAVLGALIAACAYAMRWSDALSHLRALQKSDSLYIGAARGKEDLILQFGIVSKACAEAGLASRSQALVDEAVFAAAAKGLAGRLPRDFAAKLASKQAIDRDDTEEGVQVVGLADLLLDAGQDTAAMSLLLEAQEAQIFSLWQKTKKAFRQACFVTLHCFNAVLASIGTGPGSCSAAVAEAAVSAALLQLAEKRAFRATRGFVVVTGRGLGSLRTSPLLLPAISSFLSQLGLDIRQELCLIQDTADSPTLSMGATPKLNVRATASSTWAIVGVILLLLNGVRRCVPVALQPFTQGLGPAGWCAYVLSGFFFIYAEGYRGFQQKFSPLVVRRALLLDGQQPFHRQVLAPAYAMAFFHAHKRRKAQT